MSRAVVVLHGPFGRATLYSLNKPMATHAHREAHLIFPVQGAPAIATVSDRRAAVTAGQAAAVNPWQPHSFDPCDREHGSLFLILYINPIWFLECGRSAKSALRFGRPEIAVAGQIERLLKLVASLLLEADGKDLLDGYLFALARECLHQSWQWTDGRPQASINQLWPPVRDYRIRNSIELMRQRVSDTLVLDDIAREAGLSRPHFYKLFRKHVGLTPNIYLNTLKMEASIDRLTRSSDLVTDIARELGFSSQASFTRFFSSNAGIPPTDYRRVTQIWR